MVVVKNEAALILAFCKLFNLLINYPEYSELSLALHIYQACIGKPGQQYNKIYIYVYWKYICRYGSWNPGKGKGTWLWTVDSLFKILNYPLLFIVYYPHVNNFLFFFLKKQLNSKWIKLLVFNFNMTMIIKLFLEFLLYII